MMVDPLWRNMFQAAERIMSQRRAAFDRELIQVVGFCDSWRGDRNSRGVGKHVVFQVPVSSTKFGLYLASSRTPTTEDSRSNRRMQPTRIKYFLRPEVWSAHGLRVGTLLA